MRTIQGAARRKLRMSRDPENVTCGLHPRYEMSGLVVHRHFDWGVGSAVDGRGFSWSRKVSNQQPLDFASPFYALCPGSTCLSVSHFMTVPIHDRSQQLQETTTRILKS